MNSDGLPVDGLLDATISRDIVKVQVLMRSGIDPCMVTFDGTTPMHTAAVIEPPFGSAIISTMLRYGADPNVKTRDGLTPLHVAAMWGRASTIDILLDSGADVALKDQDDMSPLDYAELADDCRDECIDALTRYRGVRGDENDSGCEMFTTNYQSVQSSYYMTPAREPNGNYIWSDKNEMKRDFMYGIYQPYFEYYLNEEGGNCCVYSCDEDKSSDNFIFETPEISCKQISKMSTPIKMLRQKAVLESKWSFSDVSDISDAGSDNDDTPDKENSSTDSFWSVSSVPYSRDTSMVRSVVKTLHEELAAEEKKTSSPHSFRCDEVIVVMCSIQESFRWKIRNFYRLCDVAERLISTVHFLDIPALIMEDSTYDFGPTVSELDISQSWVFKKTSFSAVNDELKEYLKNQKNCSEITNIILCGLETHISVQQTALDLLSENYNVHVVSDASSSASYDDHMFALERIRQDGGFINSSETIISMLLQDQTHPKYDMLMDRGVSAATSLNGSFFL